MLYKTNDFATYANNYYFAPANANGKHLGPADQRHRAFAVEPARRQRPRQQQLVTMESAATYGYIYTGSAAPRSRRN